MPSEWYPSSFVMSIRVLSDIEFATEQKRKKVKEPSQALSLLKETKQQA